MKTNPLDQLERICRQSLSRVAKLNKSFKKFFEHELDTLNRLIMKLYPHMHDNTSPLWDGLVRYN